MVTDRDIDRALGRASLEGFCELMDESYVSAAHTKLVCERLEALERGDIQKLLIEEPPSHSKTYHVSERFPAWYMGKRPKGQVILASYAAELAEANSRRARDLVMDADYPFETKVKTDVAATQRWETTAGGVVVAAGVRGGITGKHSNLLIIDDPVKDRADADSEAMRDANWKWYGEVARTRLLGKGQQILTMTRWHEDDLAGRILNSPGAASWTIVRLPAIAEEGDILGRSVGDALWPEFYPASELADIRETLSPRAWESLYQQRPVADGGNIVAGDWFRRYVASERPGFVRVEQFVDAAFKEGTRTDYSVIATWGMTAQRTYYLLDVWRDRVDFPHLLAAIYRENALARARYSKSVPVIIEDRASGQSAIQTLRSAGRSGVQQLQVIAWPEAVRAKHDKEYRGLKNTGKVARLEGKPITFIEGGQVYIPLRTPKEWKGATVEDFLTEHEAFPSGSHDDMVDTTIMALWRFSKSGMSGMYAQQYRRSADMIGMR